MEVAKLKKNVRLMVFSLHFFLLCSFIFSTLTGLASAADKPLKFFFAV
jgi:hypothetical protein